jgi:hypothetical protein
MSRAIPHTGEPAPDNVGNGRFCRGGRRAAGNGNYTNSNGGLNNGNFDPYIQNTGTFVLTDASITPSTTITAVSLNFGTGPDTILHAVRTPEPGQFGAARQCPPRSRVRASEAAAKLIRAQLLAAYSSFPRKLKV